MHGIQRDIDSFGGQIKRLCLFQLLANRNSYSEKSALFRIIYFALSPPMNSSPNCLKILLGQNVVKKVLLLTRRHPGDSYLRKRNKKGEARSLLVRTNAYVSRGAYAKWLY